MNPEHIDITRKQEHFPVISDKELDELRQRIGVKITKTVEPWITEANVDAIRHYALGIGDDNPLWLDPEYARKTRYGGIIAPPTILYAANRVISGYVGGLPGIHAMFAGTDWTWHLPIVAGTRMHTEVYLKDLVEHETGCKHLKPGRFHGLRCLQPGPLFWKKLQSIPPPTNLTLYRMI